MAIPFHLPAPLSHLLNLPAPDVRKAQMRVLRKLMSKAAFTEFGNHYRFHDILNAKHIAKTYQQVVEIYDYNKMHAQWWQRGLAGEENISWPGTIDFYALSSGTSEAASKYIPVTKELLKANNKTSIAQLSTISSYQNVNLSNLGRNWLIVGGSTELQKIDHYQAGDLSGIQQKNLPTWFRSLYKPGKEIAKVRDWSSKLDLMVKNAADWDIGVIAGVPAWVQLLIQKIIAHYQLQNIHDIWPNFSMYAHGGVAFEPYRKTFDQLLAYPITYIETYLASEGFLAYQDRQFAKGMKLAYDNNIFFEFIPFDEKNFDADGNVFSHAEAFMLHEIKEGIDYAVLISTNSGAWRYLIGDTIRLVDRKLSEIIITGRTKHFLSLVGEHLSVDNMNQALSLCGNRLGVSFGEFTVIGHSDPMSHHWYIACDDQCDQDRIQYQLDECLKEINDDYAVERKHALKEIIVRLYPAQVFLDFLATRGKLGGQHKFPRVLKGQIKEDWLNFLHNRVS
jgi:hypothetical protein